MGDVLPFRLRRSVAAEPSPLRVAIEGALAVALDTVDHLIAALDDMDGDLDREDGGDAEPSLGAPDGYSSQVVWCRGGDGDCEEDRRPCI